MEVSKVTVAMQRALRMIALGVDYRRYVQFEILTPRVNRYMSGSTHYTVTAVQQNLTAQDYQTCRRFVIESALQAAKADAALDARMQDLQANRSKSGVSPTSIEREWTGPA